MKESIQDVINQLSDVSVQDSKDIIQIKLMVAQLNAMECLRVELRDIRAELAGINNSLDQKL